MAKKRRWMPAAVPGIRDNLVTALVGVAQHAEQALAQPIVPDDAQTEVLQTQIDRSSASAKSLRKSDLIWVSADMADVALDASQDMPGVERPDMFSDSGFMLFEKPLPPRDTVHVGGMRLRDDKSSSGLQDTDYVDPIPVDGMAWMPVGDQVRIDMLVRTERLPAPLLPVPSAVTPFLTVETTIPSQFDDDRTFLGPNGAIPPEGALGEVAFLAAAWHLMALPNVADAHDLDAKTGTKTPAHPAQRASTQSVRVVDVRPMRSVRTGQSGPGERTYRNRWVVRGHWRLQPYGEKQAKRRTTWIESYIKGPEGAPLKRREVVRAWRR